MDKTKIIADPESLTRFICYLQDFVSSVLDVNKYDDADGHEDEMQYDLSKYMSKWCDVLREVSVPPCNRKGDRWEIDESMKPSKSSYITGELKIHTKHMSDARNFSEDVKEDIDRMTGVMYKYFDVTMGFIMFITCNKEERDEVRTYAKSMEWKTCNPQMQEQGYYSIIAYKAPSEEYDHSARLYAEEWSERLENVRKDGTEEDNYFPKRLIRMKRN